eukprot:9786127-Lingulodinium_polyedra.AAC.1
MGARCANVISEHSLARFRISRSPVPSPPLPPAQRRPSGPVPRSSDALTCRPRPSAWLFLACPRPRL